MKTNCRNAESGVPSAEFNAWRPPSPCWRARTPHSTLRIPQSAFGTPHSALRIRHSALRTPHSALHSGFTLVEIAISLGVIAFALVAIVGVLPIGLGVQRDNRQETIINQDESVFMDAIRNGRRGLDDLTNYVLAITNSVTFFNTNSGAAFTSQQGYTFTNSTPSGFLLTNGFRIIGLLSTPRLTPAPGGINSNYVVAFVRSLSGPASEKFPQTNRDVQDLALSYRMIPEISQYAEYDTNWTSGVGIAKKNFALIATNLQNNLYNMRLTFRWPLLPNGSSGPSRQVFRAMAGGQLLQTNEPGYTNPLYFFQPRTYVNASVH